MNITINGVEYEPVDTPITDGMFTHCKDCDIYKARPPKKPSEYPLCDTEGNSKAQRECSAQFVRGIHRIYKRVNKED